MKTNIALKKLSVILLALILLFQLTSCFESKYFEPGEVIIVLTPEESAKMLNYTPDDFSYVGCIEIRELGASNSEKRMFVLYIEDNSATGVQHAVDILNGREGIESASINAIVSID